MPVGRNDRTATVLSRGGGAVVRKAASFSMIPRDRMKRFFLEHRRGALTELLMC